MDNQITKDILRQVEIIAAVNSSPGKFSEDDMAGRYTCSVQSIRRDFKMIRNEGIAIHSRKGFLEIDNKINLQKLNKFITLYLTMNRNEHIKNLRSIESKFKNKTLNIFVKIIKAINGKRKLILQYGRNKFGDPVIRNITPIGFNRTSHSFHLIGIENDEPGNVKFYLFERIIDIKFTKEKSSLETFPKLHDIYKFAWAEFTGISEPSNVELLFDKSCEDYLRDKIFVQDQELLDRPEGIILKLKVKLSYEFIAWVMGWGGEVKVLKPAKLKKMVVERARRIVEVNG